MKRWVARLVAVLCLAAYFLTPLACSSRGRVHPFLAELPSNPILDEPVIFVKLGSQHSVTIPAGATYSIVMDGQGRRSGQKAESDVQIEFTGAGLKVGGGSGYAEQDVLIKADPTVKVDGKLVHHPVRLVRAGDTTICIAELPIEEYVAGVVAGEMYLSWPLESLKAQAVAARSYALAHMLFRPAGQKWDVTAGTGHQMFAHIGKDSVAHKAALETRGIVLMYGSRVLMSFYHSVSGGRTADCSSVYNCPPLLPLSSVVVPVPEDSPYDEWAFEMTIPAFMAKLGLSASSRLASVSVERHPDNTVKRLNCSLSDGKATVTGREVRDKVGNANIKSLWFQPAISGGMVRFTGRGFGHRVGMSQWGARALAEQGYDASTILAAFYPGSRPMRLYR